MSKRFKVPDVDSIFEWELLSYIREVRSFKSNKDDELLNSTLEEIEKEEIAKENSFQLIEFESNGNDELLSECVDEMDKKLFFEYLCLENIPKKEEEMIDVEEIILMMSTSKNFPIFAKSNWPKLETNTHKNNDDEKFKSIEKSDSDSDSYESDDDGMDPEAQNLKNEELENANNVRAQLKREVANICDSDDDPEPVPSTSKQTDNISLEYDKYDAVLSECAENIDENLLEKQTDKKNDEDMDDNDILYHFETKTDPIETDKMIAEFYSNNDTDFHTAIMTHTKKTNVSELRQKCKRLCAQFKFDIRLFNRIPMYMFRIFAADDPCCYDTEDCAKLQIATNFMIINIIEPAMMAALYAEAGQSVLICDKLHKYFETMKILFSKTEPHAQIGVFGTNFAFDLYKRKLSQIDGTIVERGTVRGNTEPFVHGSDFRRLRLVRKLLRQGKFTAFDELELREIKRSFRDGLRRKGLRGGIKYSSSHLYR